MKTKAEIQKALAKTEEDSILIGRILEKVQSAQERGYLTNTRFLDLREGAMCRQAVRLCGAEGQTAFFGGYADAERVIALFFPDYMTAEDAVQQAPIALLCAKKHPGDTLSHRDYLGAMMGLQIKREMIGDILIQEDGADILVLEEGATVDFLLQNFSKAGRKSIILSRQSLSALRPPKQTEQEKQGSVASLRLDCVIAEAFGLSRAQAQEQIARGVVFRNSLLSEKNEQEVSEGDRITVRGMGRMRLIELGGQSRKGRQWIRYGRSGS